LDRAAVYEFAILALLAPLVIAATWAALPGGLGAGVSAVLIMLLPLFGASQAATLMIRDHVASERARMRPEVEQALEQFVEDSEDIRADDELADALVELLEQTTGLSWVMLWVASGEGRLVPVGAVDTAGRTLDPSPHEWLIDHRTPLYGHELVTRRLGNLREHIEELLAALDCDVLVPLVDRDALVGLITATPPEDGRALADAEALVLKEAARAAAKALTFIGLFREAE